MSYVRAIAVISFCGLMLAVIETVPAQDRIGPGSTVSGDILRGEGVYLRGRGLYEMYSANGRRVDAETEIMIQNWNKQVYDSYLRERASHMRYQTNLTNAQQVAAKRRMAEKEVRLRTNPTDDDIVSGDALNALLIDLTDPSIHPSLWRNAAVGLPPGISIRSLFFRFAPRIGDQNSGSLSNNLIALGRLDPSRGWPIYIPEDKVGPERRAYEATHRELLNKCETDKLTLDAVTKVDAALKALKARVNTQVPVERNFRSTAVKYVADMQVATKIFDASTIDFAQEMIRDTHDYTPQTVGELLAFLRKYRLFFASASGRPDDGEVYRTLFVAMREQKEKLGLKTSLEIKIAEPPLIPPMGEARRPELMEGGVWSVQGTELVKEGPGLGRVFFGGPNLADFDYTFEAMLNSANPNAFKFPFRSNGNGYMLVLGSYNNTQYEIARWAPPKASVIQSVPGSIIPHRWYKVKISARGQRFRIELDGRVLFTFSDNLSPSGGVGLVFLDSDGRFRNIKVTAPDGTILWEGPPTYPRNDDLTHHSRSVPLRR